MKKLTSLILCGALCAGILVGCGKTDGNSTASSSTAAATEATTEATTEAVAPSYESAQALLESIHKAMPDDAEFPAAGGDYETSVDDAPGAFDPSNADNLNFLLTVPTEDASLIDDAASLMHMMNANTFTCGALRVKNGDDAAKLAEDLRDAIQNKQWMCGFPDKLVIATLGNYVVSVYGDEELVNTFRDKLQAAYSDAAIAYDEMIGEGEFSDGEDTALEAPVA